jgi:hypothetical protein
MSEACVRLALAIDAKTAHAFKPELALPEASASECWCRLY